MQSGKMLAASIGDVLAPTREEWTNCDNVHQQRQFWDDQFVAAHSRGDPERMMICWRFLQQCDDIIAALTARP